MAALGDVVWVVLAYGVGCGLVGWVAGWLATWRGPGWNAEAGITTGDAVHRLLRTGR